MKNILRIITFASVGVLFLLLAGVVSVAKPLKTPKVTVGLVEFDVEAADEPSEWRKGLVGHAPLQTGEGMLFIFPTATTKTFWMKGMSFPLDLIWIRDRTVVGFVDRALPDRGEQLYYSPEAVDQVLEIGAGERSKLGITVGSPVTVE